MSKKLKTAIKREYLNCIENPTHFLCKYSVIQHPQRGKIKFNLYDFQHNVLQKIKIQLKIL